MPSVYHARSNMDICLTHRDVTKWFASASLLTNFVPIKVGPSYTYFCKFKQRKNALKKERK